MGTDAVWDFESVSDLPTIRAAGQAADGSVWVVTGGRGDPVAALQLDPETLETTPYPIDDFSGDLRTVITDETIWILDRGGMRVGTFDVTSHSFSGFAAVEGLSSESQWTPRLLATSDGTAWLQHDDLLVRLDASNPGSVVDQVDLTEAIPPSTERTSSPRFVTTAVDDRFLVEADGQWYLLDPADWEFTALDIPPVGDAALTATTSLPLVAPGVVGYLSSDRELVTLDLTSLETTVTDVTLTQAKMSNVANTVYGVSGADGVIALAGNHTDYELIDPVNGTRTVIAGTRGSRAETQILLTDTHLLSWVRDGHGIAVWKPTVAT